MILTCPQCATRYEIDAAKFPAAGRKVRCKKCEHVWFQASQAAPIEIPPAEPTPEPPTDQAPSEPEVPAAVEAPGGPVRSWRAANAAPVQAVPEPAPFLMSPVATAATTSFVPNLIVIGGWIALVLVILVIGWAAVSYRHHIAQTWPKSASVFSHAGMRVNARGLDFSDIKHANQIEDGQPVLEISGKLVNVSASPIKAPPLHVSLSDDQHVIYGWNFASAAVSVIPGQSVAFHTRLSNPPPAAKRVTVGFAPE